MSTLKIGVIREGKTPPDKRVPLTPEQCRQLAAQYPNVEVFVEKSPIRSFVDATYEEQGISVVDDISHCDVLIGVKEVPIPSLIPNKTYFFFSHTIKEQPYNRQLLQAILEKNIQLVDYECLTDEKGRRLLGFGRYAGIVGAYNGFLALGKRLGTFDLKPAHQCEDRVELEEELSKVQLGNRKIVLTGTGRVAHGAVEILQKLGIREVKVDEYLKQSFSESVYVRLSVLDYNKRKDGTAGTAQEFFNEPEKYEANFYRFAQVSDMFIAGHYWDANAPFLFSREEAGKEDFNIQVVADISCDIDGPVASTIRPSTIEEPLYGYDPVNEAETTYNAPGAITVMAVDNLPCELPKDASADFGAEMLRNVLPHLVGADEQNVIARASIAKGGQLTEGYQYLTDYVAGKD